MALSASTLQSQLLQAWLVPPGGAFPSTADASANRLASAVAAWFSAAQAGAFPCSTAAARKSQLASALMGALASGSAASAGQGTAAALAAYITGQVFGSGAASPPTGTSAAAAAFMGIFSDVNAPNPVRAQRFAQACKALTASTLVTFPPPLPSPLPIT
jgi:hypothetical protein